jgi:hypothetical protein
MFAFDEVHFLTACAIPRPLLNNLWLSIDSYPGFAPFRSTLLIINPVMLVRPEVNLHLP